jgi:hypothetical protein
MPASAAVWHVDASANGGDGSAQSPFSAIQDGLDAAMAGDTVIVAPGVYAEALQTQRDGTAGMPIVVRSSEPRQAVVEFSGRALDAAHANHTFEGLVIDGGYGDADAVRANGADGLRLDGVEIRRSGGDCIDAGTITGLEIVDSYIHHCVRGEAGAQTDAHGITGDSVFELRVTDTEIGMVSGDALQLSPPREPWGDVVLERVVMYSGVLDEDTPALAMGTTIGENAVDTKVGAGETPTLIIRDAIAYGWRGAISNQGAFNIKEAVDCTLDRIVTYDSEIAFRLRGPATVRVHNAVVYDADVGFRLEDGLADAAILNVTLGGDIGQLFTDAGDDPTGLDVRNLLVLGDLPAVATDASNLSVGAEVFIDADGHDYHLVEESAPVDAGITIAEVATDLDGVQRPVGAAYDVGAYEWTDEPPPGGTTGDSTTTTDTGSGTGDGSSDGGTTGASASSDGGSASSETGGGTDSDGATGGDESGCSCRNTPHHSSWALWLLMAWVCVPRRRSARTL